MPSITCKHAGTRATCERLLMTPMRGHREEDGEVRKTLHTSFNLLAHDSPKGHSECEQRIL